MIAERVGDSSHAQPPLAAGSHHRRDGAVRHDATVPVAIEISSRDQINALPTQRNRIPRIFVERVYVCLRGFLDDV